MLLVSCLLVTLQVVSTAPTVGDELNANLQENMAAVHGNVMAAITNMIKPLMDMPAFLGITSDSGGIRGLLAAIIDKILRAIHSSVSAVSSGVKVGSTIMSAPFKLLGDGLMAIQQIYMGRSLRFPNTALTPGSKEVAAGEDGGSRQGNKRLLDRLTASMDGFNDYIADKINIISDSIRFLAAIFSG